VRWNVKRQESAQRYTAHAGSESSLKDTHWKPINLQTSFCFDKLFNGFASVNGMTIPSFARALLSRPPRLPFCCI
jgi:hypothetical protein